MGDATPAKTKGRARKTRKEAKSVRRSDESQRVPALIPYHPDYHPTNYPPVTEALEKQGIDPLWIEAQAVRSGGNVGRTPPAVTLNHAISQLETIPSDYFYTCDAHMVCEPDIHTRMRAILRKHPDTVAIHGYAYHWQVTTGPWANSMLEWQFDPVPCLSLWHYPTLMKVGGFDDRFRYGHIITTNLRLVQNGYAQHIRYVKSLPEANPGTKLLPGRHRLAGHHVDPDMDLDKFFRLHYTAGVCMATIERAFPQNPFIQQFRRTFDMAHQVVVNTEHLGSMIKSVCHSLNVLGCVEGFNLIPRGKITSANKEVQYVFEQR